MKKKKRGSTFVIVVIVMAILFITGTTILTVTANSYKMRISESKRLQNLYEADSGLDLVKNIIVKTCHQAIKYADDKVKEEIVNIESKNSEDLNTIFKKNFYDFLSLKKDDKEILKYLILNKQIIESVSESGVIETVTFEDVSENKNYIIEIEDNSYTVNRDSNKNIENITIVVKSTFETVNEDIKNKRTVSSKFKIQAPKYESEINIVDIYPVFDGKAITADGDMNVSGNENVKSSLSITGDIWVKGIGLNDLNYNNPIFTFNKYNSGIKLENTEFNISGNIYTSNTLTLNKNVKNSEINGNIYAQNIYIGKVFEKKDIEGYEESKSSNNSMFFNGNVIVNNDLAMNTTDSNITIENNFYGINDETREKIDEKSGVNEVLNSSSIIVNESGKSTLTVKGDSYILGVAYLNATNSDNQKYQTGESVAVKGNYLAYTDVQQVLNGEKNVTLRYYSPLQLLESINGNNDVKTKADYFVGYYSSEDNEEKYTYKDGGIKLGTRENSKVISAGAVKKWDEDGGKFQSSSLMEKDDEEVVKNERNEYARNVFAMGDITKLIEDKNIDIYKNQQVLRTVESEILFTKINEFFRSDLNNGTLVLNGTKSKIIIENNDLSGSKIEKGLIITNGDIVVKGNFKFTGTIITSGNIIFEGSGEKIINYDAEVVRGVIADNYNKVKGIFNDKNSKGSSVKLSSSSEMYNLDRFLIESSWKIER